MSEREEVTRLAAIADPVVRHAKALEAIEDARNLMSDLAEVRAQAVYEVYKQVGASAAGRIFDLKRTNVHRIVRDQEQRDPDPAVQQVLARRRAATLESIQELQKYLARAAQQTRAAASAQAAPTLGDVHKGTGEELR